MYEFIQLLHNPKLSRKIGCLV